MEFQALDWRTYEEEDVNGNNKFVIRIFGRTRDDKTIQVKVNNFLPFFYIRIEKNWKQRQIDALMTQLKYRVFPKENKEELVSYRIVERNIFWGFTNYEKFSFLELTFNTWGALKSYERACKSAKKPLTVREISPDPINLELFESNIEPFLRCMHIRGLDAVGWIKISEDKSEPLTELISYCDYNIQASWTSLDRVEDRTISKFRVAAFDIECISEDGSFPQAERDYDQINQIGTSFSKLGEDECYYKHIVALKSCDKLPDTDVEYYETEAEVLLAWASLIQRTDPDILTGYNINGFDFEYMKDRAKKLGIYDKFCRLSRIIGKSAEFKEADLSSAALGKNILKYFDMDGRVIIDLMKVAQRDFKLESYKLDFVAANFIKEKISKLTHQPDGTTLIDTGSVYGLKEEQYITVYYNDGITNNKHMDGKKFKIKELKPKSILVDGLIETNVMNGGFKVFWCQAKDDIGPQDIFRLQKGTSADRAIIAKYCIQDCVLCNKLIAKLQVLINNIGMANVCSVPLSYLFLRGQGVKIFSLVSKFCRERQHLIPVIKKKFLTDEEKAQAELAESLENKFQKHVEKLNKMNGDDDESDSDDEDQGYEGAIVFEPEVGIHYEPITVLDYSSLYPSSMIHKNLSHECYVIDDEKYGALPGYKYNIITYKTSTITEYFEKSKLRALLRPYSDNKYILEDVPPEKGFKKHYQVYDKTHAGAKRYLIAEIKTTAIEITIINYETSKFAEKSTGEKGIIPQILQSLLTARSKYKDEMEDAADPFTKSVFDGLQQAYKVTANSLYGQTGASTSPICMKAIAASTTATGRNQLIFSKYFIENIFGQMVNLALEDEAKFNAFCETHFAETLAKKWIRKSKNDADSWNSPEEFRRKFIDKMRSILTGFSVNPVIIYGDTDSVFFKPNIRNKETGELCRDKRTLEQSIDLGIWSSHAIYLLLEEPQKQAYEKVLWPFMILSKKRYVGNLYETDPDKYYQKSMGIVLKRRDNAPIVKMVCGGIVDYILNKRDPEGAIEFARKSLKQILSGKYPIDRFIITKTLKGNSLTKVELIEEEQKPKDQRYYKDRSRITHAVLADRMAERDPGNKPLSNDRIPYVYVITKHAELQGDRVEHPEYVLANKLKLDYLFYITNQIQKPCVQFLDLIMENSSKIFEEYVMREENRREGKKPINSFLNGQVEEDEQKEPGEIIDLNSIEKIDTGLAVKPKMRKAPGKSKAKKLVKQEIKEDPDESFSLL